MGYRENRTRFNDWLSRLEPTDFEALLAEYFRDQGSRVEHVGAAVQGRRFDGGIDLKLHRGSDYTIVQCKNWNARQVTHNAVHELLGVMLTQRASAAIVVTSGEFTAAAITAAAEEPRMRLIDGVELRRLLATWPGRERWTHTSAMKSTNAAGGVRRFLKLAGVALVLLFVSVVAFALFHTRQSDPTSKAPGNQVDIVSAVADDAPDSKVPNADANAPTPLGSRSSSSPQEQLAARTSRFVSNTLRMADPNGRIDPESARLVARRIAGVRSVVWMDQTHLIVRVDSAVHRSMQMIDKVCDALEPLGDTLGVVVAVQNANARNGDEMETLTRNCQLREGQRALGQRKRQIDTVSPEVRAQFKAMQERNQPKR